MLTFFWVESRRPRRSPHPKQRVPRRRARAAGVRGPRRLVDPPRAQGPQAHPRGAVGAGDVWDVCVWGRV